MIPGMEPPGDGNEQPPQDQDSTGIKSAMGSPVQDNDIEVNVDKSTKMPEKGLGEI